MSLARRIANLFRHSRLSREIDELLSHIEMRTEDNIRAGMSSEAARRDALLRFGNPVVLKEKATAADTELWIASLARDLRYALRRLRRSPGFAATVVVTLALGIGANVVVLGVVNALVLKPLDVPNAGHLYNVVHGEEGNDNQSYPDYLDYKERNHTFTEMAAYRYTGGSLLSGGHAEKIWIDEVSGNFFSLLGVEPALGRVFTAHDEHGPNSAPMRC